MDIGGCQRLHVHLPLRHQRMGRTVSARSQRVLRQRGHLDRINQRPARNSRNRTFGVGSPDKLCKGDRKLPALLFGILNSVALTLFLYGGTEVWVNVLAMVLFGIAIGVLICFLGGLMAVDIVPPQGYRRRIGRRGSSILLRSRHSGRSLRMAHRRTHNRRRRRHESL